VGAEPTREQIDAAEAAGAPLRDESVSC